jgi:alkylation response protein AidB-like acyl-CoA dehydrogenase
VGDLGVDLLAKAKVLAPAIAARTEADEANGTLTAETIRLLDEAGMFRLKVPKVLGGAEADPVQQLLVLEELARSNISAAWCVMVGTTGVGVAGAYLPDEAMADVFQGDVLPKFAGVVVPSGKAEPVEGGYRLTGRWAFASGIRHSQWLAASAMVTGEGAPEVRKLVFPTAAARIHDNWQVMGLKGTGSCDFSVEDVFVPRAFSYSAQNDTPRRGGPVYRFGFPGFVANEHAAMALGLARAALDRFREKETDRARSYVAGTPAMAQRPVVQQALARMELTLRAARLLAIDANRDAWATLQAGGVPSVAQHCEMRAAATYATEVALETVTQVFRHAGGSAIYDQSPLQQILRDINVAAQHRMVSEAAYENLGQAMLGMQDVNPMR